MIIIKSGIWIRVSGYQAAGCQMKGILKKTAVCWCLLLLATIYIPAYGKSQVTEVQMIPNLVDLVENSEPEEPGSLYSLSAVLMDGDSGRILYQKDGEVPRPNASTTKVLTCILALENGSGDDYVSISKNAASQPEVRLNLHEGEQYYLEDLLYSLMLKSHNDTAVAVAEHIGGSVEGFADMMNAKAKELGATHTHFVNPNGLHDNNHYTTAYDLYLIFKEAVKYDTFVDTVSSKDYTMTYTTPKKTQINEYMQSTNYYLLNEFPVPEGVVMYGGKTGTTSMAKSCLILMTKNKKGERFFSVVLGAETKDMLYSSMSQLLEKTAN